MPVESPVEVFLNDILVETLMVFHDVWMSSLTDWMASYPSKQQSVPHCQVCGERSFDARAGFSRSSQL